MAVRKITVSADLAGNVEDGPGIADGCLFVYTGETLHINFTVRDENGISVSGDTAGYYDAAIFRDSDGAMLAGTSGAGKKNTASEMSGSVHIILDTATKAMREAAQQGFESCTLHIIHYPSGSLYGEDLCRVPVFLEPACSLGISCRTPGEEFPGLPDRSAPALESLTDKGWRLNVPGEGCAWRWRFPDGSLTPVLPVAVPGAGYDISGPLARRDILCPGTADRDFLAEDVNMLYLRRGGSWSSGIQWQGDAGSDADELFAETLFLPFERKNGMISYDIGKETLHTVSGITAPRRLLIDAVSSAAAKPAATLLDGAGKICAEKKFDLRAGRSRMELEVAGSAVPGEYTLSFSLPEEENDVQLRAESLIFVFPASAAPLPDGWTLLPRMGNTAAGRVFCGRWQWTGSGAEAAGEVGSNGFFTGTDGSDWGIETGIRLGRFAPSWSIGGRFYIEAADEPFCKVLFRAGDPAGGVSGCIAACLAEYDGAGGGRILFRVNCGCTVVECAVPAEPEILFSPMCITAVFDAGRRRSGICVGGAGEDWQILPEFSAVPADVPGTAHPLLEAGALKPDRNTYTARGCGVSSFFITDRPMSGGEAAFAAALLPV